MAEKKKEIGIGAAIGLGIILFALSKRKEEAPPEKPSEITPAPSAPAPSPSAPSPPEYVVPYPPKHSLYAYTPPTTKAEERREEIIREQLNKARMGIPPYGRTRWYGGRERI